MASGMFDDLLAIEGELDSGMEFKAAEVVRENENILVDMNTQQLKKGKTSTGDTISPQYYSDDYAEMKNRMNPTPGFGIPDLFLEGDFQEGFFTEPVEGGWKNSSRDEKRDILTAKYGEGLFGNTQEDEQEFNEEYVSPELIEWIMQSMNEKL